MNVSRNLEFGKHADIADVGEIVRWGLGEQEGRSPKLVGNGWGTHSVSIQQMVQQF